MNAREFTRLLGGRWSGTYGSCRCPAHDDASPSLSVRDGEKAVILTCHAGCDRRDILQAIKVRGGDIAGDKYSPAPHQGDKAQLGRNYAREIWSKSVAITGTLAETYLRSRGITIPLPDSLRFNVIKHKESNRTLPALIAAITDADGAIQGIQRTYLRLDGRGKADLKPNKMSLGTARGGFVRVGLMSAPCIIIAEGVENALSVVQATGYGGIAICGSTMMPSVALPHECRSAQIVIAGDNDSAGRKGAYALAERLSNEGWVVRIAFLEDGDSDWNDALCADHVESEERIAIQRDGVMG